MSQISAESTLNKSFWISKAWQGAFFKVFSCACFACINGIVRYLSRGSLADGIDPLPVSVIMFFQNLFGTLFLIPWLLKFKIAHFKTHHPLLHTLRVTSAVLGIFLWYLTLKMLPLAESVALTFTGPIFTVIGATLFLKEKIDLKRSIAIFLSLTGAFIISRPDIALNGSHALGLGALLPLASTIAFTLDKILTRKLAKKGESPTSMAIYLLVLMAPLSLLPALFEWTSPNQTHYLWLILGGALAALAHLSFGKAYQLAEVSFLTPVGFIKFFFSTFVGFIAFNELPTHWSLWIGISIIFLSILFLGFKIPFKRKV